MIPLLSLDAPDQLTLPELRLELRRKLAAAEALLERAQRSEREAAALPPAATLAATQRLLAEQRRLAAKRVQLYRSTLQTVEAALAGG